MQSQSDKKAFLSYEDARFLSIKAKKLCTFLICRVPTDEKNRHLFNVSEPFSGNLAAECLEIVIFQGNASAEAFVQETLCIEVIFLYG